MIRTPRLALVPATPELVRAALAGPEVLGAALGVDVPADWPPEFIDEAALAFTLERLAGGPDQAGWWMHFVVLDQPVAPPRLVGSAGFKGPPDTDGSCEIGYSIVPSERGHGVAVEAARALLDHAFGDPRVVRVVGETLPTLVASIVVMLRAGFRYVGAGSEPGVVRFERTRPTDETVRAPTRIRAVVPMAHVASVPRAAAFYAHLGFQIGNSFSHDGGEPSWAWLDADGVALMVARASGPIDAAQQAVLFYLYCHDPAALRRRLFAAGIEAGELCFPFHSPRGEFRLHDPDGYVVMVRHT